MQVLSYQKWYAHIWNWEKVRFINKRSTIRKSNYFWNEIRKNRSLWNFGVSLTAAADGFVQTRGFFFSFKSPFLLQENNALWQRIYALWAVLLSLNNKENLVVGFSVFCELSPDSPVVKVGVWMWCSLPLVPRSNPFAAVHERERVVEFVS